MDGIMYGYAEKMYNINAHIRSDQTRPVDHPVLSPHTVPDHLSSVLESLLIIVCGTELIPQTNMADAPRNHDNVNDRVSYASYNPIAP